MPLDHSPDSNPLTMTGLTGPGSAKESFLIFYSSVVDGRMWCPDCVAVEGVVKSAFEGANKPRGVVYWVGPRAEWRDPKNRARTDWNVQSVPTIIRFTDGKESGRLVEKEILDADRLESFVAGK